MTGFEPATLTLAMSFGPTSSPAITQIDAASLPILIAHDCPQVTIIVNGAWYFRGVDFTEFCTTCTTSTAPFRSDLAVGCFASARRGKSPSVALRLSNSLTPRAPCRWRAVVGGVNQRSAAVASPNHTRLPLGFGHLPSLSSVVKTYPLIRPVGGMRRASYLDSVALVLHSPRRAPFSSSKPN
jgi:hypothetical protein